MARYTACFLLLIAVFAISIPSFSQSRFSLEAGIGRTLFQKDPGHLMHHKNYIGQLYAGTDAPRMVNYGLGMGLHYRKFNYRSAFNLYSADVISFSHTYFTLSPTADFRLDKKSRFHLQLGLPFGFLANGNDRVHYYYNDGRGTVRDTTYNTDRLIAKLNVRFAASFYYQFQLKKQWSLFAKLTYQQSLGGVDNVSEGGAYIYANDLLLTLGANFHYAKQKRVMGTK